MHAEVTPKSARGCSIYVSFKVTETVSQARRASSHMLLWIRFALARELLLFDVKFKPGNLLDTQRTGGAHLSPL
eukprot:1231550-Pleurochrysis_carterae.AAC.4